MDSFSRYLFRRLLPYSVSRQTRLIVTLVLVLIVGFLWYCEKKEETPPLPKAAQSSASQEAAPAPALTATTAPQGLTGSESGCVSLGCEKKECIGLGCDGEKCIGLGCEEKSGK